MSDFEKSSEHENWLWLREKSISDLMDLLDARDDLESQIEEKMALLALLDALLKPPL